MLKRLYSTFLVLVVALFLVSNPSIAAEDSMGSLKVKTIPRGAEIIINGRHVGKSPLLLDPFKTGTARVKARLPGYRPWDNSIRVRLGERSEMVLILARESGAHSKE